MMKKFNGEVEEEDKRNVIGIKNALTWFYARGHIGVKIFVSNMHVVAYDFIMIRFHSPSAPLQI